MLWHLGVCLGFGATILVFLIIDLDRPRRGLIAVDQSALAATVATMQP